MEDEREEEEEVMFVNTVQQEEDDWQEPDDSWLELDGGESEEEAGVYLISACLRKDDSVLEDELEYFHDVTPPPEKKGAAEVRCWSPEPRGLQSEEEDEEENQHLGNLITGGLKTGRSDSELTQSQTKAAAAPVARDRQTREKGSEEEKRSPQEDVNSSESPTTREFQGEDAQRKGGEWRAGKMGDCKERCMAERAAHR
jgi:hypothetical protein